MPPAAVSLRSVALRDGLDRGHVGALHQAFLVHVRVEELVAVGFERCTACTAVIGSTVFQPWITTRPAR